MHKMKRVDDNLSVSTLWYFNNCSKKKCYLQFYEKRKKKRMKVTCIGNKDDKKLNKKKEGNEGMESKVM